LIPTAAAVAAQAPAGPKKDSVELLLEGMPAVQPQAPRTMPQTAGQSSAAYHAEHTVRPAHTSPDEMPKVVVERAPQRATVRIDRAKLQAVIEQAHAQAPTPHDPGLPMSLRVAIALVAGLAVVLAIFLVTRASASSTPTAAPAPSVLPKVGPVVPPPTVTAAIPPPPPIDTSAATPPVIADSALPPAPPAAPAAKPKPRPQAAPGPSGDLGEFKTTFH
jgi:hypothetical protein